MGRIAKLLSFIRTFRNEAQVSDVKIDSGGGALISAENFQSSGDDANPMPGDYVTSVNVEGTGRESVVGYVDPKNEPKALIGEKRIYARDENGTTIVEIWLKNTGETLINNELGFFMLRPDGSMRGDNGKGYFDLSPNGDFLVNQVTIDIDGNITSPATITAPNIVGAASVIAAGKELVNHRHKAGDPPGDTGVNL